MVSVFGSPGARGLIFFDTADPAHNREIAPGGVWVGSGWDFQGYFKNVLGTMISPRHFLSVEHVGFGPGDTTFVHKSFFAGAASDRTYFLNPNANAGAGSWIIPGTDLRVFEVYGDFPAHAELYTKSNESGKQTVMMGRGRQRGAAVTLASETRGWLWGSNDQRARWGVNVVDSIEPSSSAADLLVTDFDEAPGTEECQAASGDSGGALFIKDGATWKLAGVIYAVDGKYDTNTTCEDSSDFNAAMFDALGFFIGSDNAACDQWEPVTVGDDTDESRAYASRVSASASAIQAIIQAALDDAIKTPLQRYDDWMTGYALGAETLPGEDADHDLQPNVIEYLAALDPGADDHPEGAFQVEEAAGKIRFTIRLRLDADARGLSWEIQQTDDLVARNYLAVTGLAQVGLTRSLAEGTESIAFEGDQPAGPRMYYRLEVTLAP